MNFKDSFTPKEKMELLERSIIVNSFAYYILDTNFLSDYKYDKNSRQLLALIKEYPDEFEVTRYHLYFKEFVGTGYYLADMIKETDPNLYDNVLYEANFVANTLHK